MRARSLLRAAVPVAIAIAALVVREHTRVPFVELPAPGSARVFTPPADLVRAALESPDGEHQIAPDRDGWFLTPATRWLAELYRQARVTAGAARIDTSGGTVSLSIDVEIDDDRFPDPLSLRFQPAALRASVVPGVRSAEWTTVVQRGSEELELGAHLHLIALGDGAARALLVGRLETEDGDGFLALELALSRRR